MISRRNFIRFSLSSVPILCLVPHIYRASKDAPLKIVGSKEPGQPIVVSGHVYGEDDRTPVTEAALHVYHTDASGYYSKPRNDPRTARIHASIPVRKDGFYAFQTVMPAHYVIENPPPAHIHVHLSVPGVPDHWIDSFLFAGDRFLTREQISNNEGRGTRSAIMTPVRRAGGVVYFVRDIRLDRKLAERNQLVNGWYRNP